MACVQPGEQRNGLFVPVYDFDWIRSTIRTQTTRVTITVDDMAEVFDCGKSELPRADAAKALQTLTGAGRTACYSALKLDGQFGKQLRANRGLLTWRA